MCPVSGHPISEDATVIVATAGCEQEIRDDGAAIVAPSYGQFQEDACFKGFLVSADTPGDHIEDHKIDKQVYVKGGQYWTTGGTSGDYAEASVIDKDDILGLFALYGLVPGVDVLELFKFAESIYINPQGTGFASLDTPDTAMVVSGLYLRTKLHLTGQKDVDFGVTYLWFEE